MIQLDWYFAAVFIAALALTPFAGWPAAIAAVVVAAIYALLAIAANVLNITEDPYD